MYETLFWEVVKEVLKKYCLNVKKVMEEGLQKAVGSMVQEVETANADPSTEC